MGFVSSAMPMVRGYLIRQVLDDNTPHNSDAGAGCGRGSALLNMKTLLPYQRAFPAVKNIHSETSDMQIISTHHLVCLNSSDKMSGVGWADSEV